MREGCQKPPGPAGARLQPTLPPLWGGGAAGAAVLSSTRTPAVGPPRCNGAAARRSPLPAAPHALAPSGDKALGAAAVAAISGKPGVCTSSVEARCRGEGNKDKKGGEKTKKKKNKPKNQTKAPKR